MEEPLELFQNVDLTLFPGSLTIRALRDSRYHNTAYAIAELIDNSIEAKAGHIELLCMEDWELVQERNRQRLSEVAVLDDGEGMEPLTLVEALKFGGGTRHNTTRGIGKYGMGLPTASMSQGKRVDVWTWRDGIDSVWHSSIDADEIEGGCHTVPLPDQHTPIPDHWRAAGSSEIYGSRSGTLVVWSDLDKIQWKTGKAIIDNTAREVGRIHRHFIHDGLVHIHAATFLSNQSRNPEWVEFMPNDPLYLMAPSSVPEAPWGEEPMFSQWGETKNYPVMVGSTEETITVTYSIVRPEVLETANPGRNPGDTERGKHTRHNIGVSVVREGREIVLERAFQREGGSAENPQNRWWGCEISFGRNCDEMFGVDHSKQMVSNFTQAAKTFASDDRTRQIILDEMEVEDDPIYRVVGMIRDETSAMMKQIRLMFAQRRPSGGTEADRGKRTPEATAAKVATQAHNVAIAEGQDAPTKTDIYRDEIPPELREAGLTQELTDEGKSLEQAQEEARILVNDGDKYRFRPAQLDAFHFFNVRSSNAMLHIGLNTDHAVYDLIQNIEGSLDEDGDENDPAYQATVAIRLFLAAWAEMEDQTQAPSEQAQIQYIAGQWGRQVSMMLQQWRDRTG